VLTIIQPPLTTEINFFESGYGLTGDSNEEYVTFYENKDDSFIHKLKKTIENNKTISNPGFAGCKLCKNLIARDEYKLTNKNDVTFVFPSGIKHYFECHCIKPSPEFREFIMNF